VVALLKRIESFDLSREEEVERVLDLINKVGYCNILYYTALDWTTLHWTAMHYNVLGTNAVQ
jgi:hypothetical protein